MDTVNQATAECFNALTQLRELEAPIGTPDMIHNRLIGFVDAMREKARDIGISQRDADDMAYAIVALCDEIAMGKPEPMRGYWMSRPLQLHFFQENLAGDGFFNRLEEIRRDTRRLDVLRVYYQCLLLGFQGKYAMRGGEIELLRIVDSIRPEVNRHIEVPDNLSPAGDLTEAAANLFRLLHEIDATGVAAIAVAPIPGEGLGEAINDRLKRAASPRT